MRKKNNGKSERVRTEKRKKKVKSSKKEKKKSKRQKTKKKRELGFGKNTITCVWVSCIVSQPLLNYATHQEHIKTTITIKNTSRLLPSSRISIK